MKIENNGISFSTKDSIVGFEGGVIPSNKTTWNWLLFPNIIISWFDEQRGPYDNIKPMEHRLMIGLLWGRWYVAARFIRF